MKPGSTAPYIPARGDIIWIDFNPQAGREQSGHRPAIVISPLHYNSRVGLALLCPITSQVKGYPFEVKLPEGMQISGVALADQVKSLDWKIRQAKLIEQAPDAVIDELLAKLKPLIF